MRKELTVVGLHNAAMAVWDAALEVHKQAGPEAATPVFAEAARLERQALAMFLRLSPTVEPSRSVLHASAAQLALKACEFRAAIDLASEGLRGSPPVEIARELRAVLRAVAEG